MKMFRVGSILAINGFIVLMLIKAMFFPDGPDDVFGLFFIGVCIFFNLYMLLIYYVMPLKEKPVISLEILYSILLVLPIIALWYFTT